MNVTDPLITIVIPVFDDIRGLRVTLNSLRSMAPSVPCEVIVCDDAGPPGVRRLANEMSCRHVRLEVNSGSYAARNAGIFAAKSERLAFVDADQEVSSEWLMQGFNALDKHPYVGGRIIVRSTTGAGPWFRYSCAREFLYKTYLRDGYFPTANLFVQRSLFQEVGFFNENLRSSGDTEFAERARKAGVIPKFESGAITYHPARNKAQLLRKRRRLAAGRAQLQLRLMHRSVMKTVAGEYLKILLSPLRFLWRLVSRTNQASKFGLIDYFRFFVFDEVLSINQSRWTIVYCRQINRNAFQAFQDESITAPTKKP